MKVAVACDFNIYLRDGCGLWSLHSWYLPNYLEMAVFCKGVISLLSILFSGWLCSVKWPFLAMSVLIFGTFVFCKSRNFLLSYLHIYFRMAVFCDGYFFAISIFRLG